jgi:hypothetical protein
VLFEEFGEWAIEERQERFEGELGWIQTRILKGHPDGVAGGEFSEFNRELDDQVVEASSHIDVWCRATPCGTAIARMWGDRLGKGRHGPLTGSPCAGSGKSACDS